MARPLARSRFALSLLLCAPAAGWSSVGSGDELLFPGASYAVGHAGERVELVDLDGDGHVDVVTGTGFPVGIFLGNGDGTLTPVLPLDIDHSAGPGIGDLNGDGVPDLVTGNWGSLEVSLGNGDGTFAAPTSFPSSARDDLAVGDLNGDGFADLVGATSTGVNVLFGDGTGAFGAETTLTLSVVERVAVRDVNGDGSLDVLALGWQSFRVLLGDGAGGLTPTHHYQFANLFEGYCFGDFDGDGESDVAVCTRGNDVLVYFGAADGSFPTRSNVFAGSSNGEDRGIDACDVDGDGHADLVVASGVVDGVKVLRNDGAGGFGAPEIVRAANPSVDVACTDLDGDGITDLLVLGNDQTIVLGDHRELTVLVGEGGGVFRARSEYRRTGQRLSHLRVGQFVGDASPDAVLHSTFGQEVLYRGADDGTFTFESEFQVAGADDTMVAADLDADGFTDLVTANGAGSAIHVTRCLGNGAFASGVQYALPVFETAEQVAVADFDGDGALDVVVRLDASNQEFCLFPGNGDGTLAAALRFTIPDRASHLSVTDLDGDGDPDLVLRSPTLGLFTLLGDGSFGFSSPVLTGIDLHLGQAAFRDVDGDGFVDMIGGSSATPGVHVWSGLGDGSFSAPAVYGAFDCFNVVAVEDVDGDGRLDLLASDCVRNAVQVMAGTAGGAFEAPGDLAYGLGGRSEALHLLLLDRDDRPDVLTASGEGLSVLLSTDGASAPRSHGIAAPNSHTSGAKLSWSGSRSVAANDFTLTVDGCPPGEFGLFFYGPERASVPFGNNGYLNVGAGSIGLLRVPPRLLTDGAGSATKTFDFGSHPMNAGAGEIAPGGTWNFQFWYRNPGHGFNLSDAIEVTFCP